MRPEPFRLEPEFSPRIWGARSLAPLYPLKTALAEPIGEAWLTGEQCRVAEGPFCGHPLHTVWREMPAEWRGSRFAGTDHFPLLVKFIFPKDKLSIQVHPDDAYAAQHEQAAGGRGKTEMWHAVSAESGARVLLGMKPGAGKEKFLAALAAQTLEKLLEKWPVGSGDTFFVPAGTPHSIGPGMVLCEIQEYSDLTYRVYDYGRVDASGKLRELHLEKALAVMNFGPFAGGRVLPLPLPAAGEARRLLAACRYFAAERWELAGPFEGATRPEQFDLFVILHGSGEMRWASNCAAYHRGDAWYLPAALGRFRLAPQEETALLRAYVPDLARLRKELLERGAVEAAVSGVLFE